MPGTPTFGKILRSETPEPLLKYSKCPDSAKGVSLPLFPCFLFVFFCFLPLFSLFCLFSSFFRFLPSLPFHSQKNRGDLRDPFCENPKMALSGGKVSGFSSLGFADIWRNPVICAVKRGFPHPGSGENDRRIL